MLRVILTTDVYHPLMSGVTRVVDILLEELPRYNTEYFLLAPAYTPGRWSLERKNGGYIFRLNSFRLVGIYKDLRIPDPVSSIIVLRHKIGAVLDGDSIVVHAHTPYVSTSILRAATRGKVTGLPIILTFHTLINRYLEARFGSARYFFEVLDVAFTKSVFERVDLIIFPSKYALNVMAGYIGWKNFERLKNKIRVIPNPLPRRSYEPPKRRISEIYDFLEEDNYALWVGRISHEKNIPFIMKIFAGLPYKLVIVGKGPLLKSLKRIAPPNIRFLGFVDDETLKSLLHYARVFVIASKFDNLPLAVMEALAQGLPVVSYYLGGHNEYVLDGYSGYKYKTIKEARKYINKIFRDDDLRERMREGSRKIARMFHPDKVIPQHLKLYKRLAIRW